MSLEKIKLIALTGIETVFLTVVLTPVLLVLSALLHIRHWLRCGRP